MGGTTITIQEDTLLKALDSLMDQRKEIEETHHLFLNSITILEKKEATRDKGVETYQAIGDKGIEAKIGPQYTAEQLEKNIIIFAHFGK